MEVGPTCHYVMGGVEVDADTGAATVPGLFAAGECAGGMHTAPTGWAAIRCPICWYSAGGASLVQRITVLQALSSQTSGPAEGYRCAAASRR